MMVLTFSIGRAHLTCYHIEGLIDGCKARRPLLEKESWRNTWRHYIRNLFQFGDWSLNLRTMTLQLWQLSCIAIYRI